MTPPKPRSQDSSIVAVDKFILSTRDSGYKGTSSAISELVDNAIQADAQTVEIIIESVQVGRDSGIVVSVLDDGCGMDVFTLRQSLRFGGSSRFDARDGLGRFGMGLPNSSLSQAQRVEVYSWQRIARKKREGAKAKSPNVYMSYLDVEEIAERGITEVPRPRLVETMPQAGQSLSGTLVRWLRCDRLDYRRVSTIARKLDVELGRRFRYFLWGGLSISVNGRRVRPIDPLYVHADSRETGASLFGEELVYEIHSDPHERHSPTGRVTVCFSELPVHELHRLSNKEKRARGISKGAGVSIVRAGREVDFGWFFMGSKRRENYDDWWRCEVKFEPVLDEAFGITHTKQQIRPQAYLLEQLSEDIEATAKALNARVRRAHAEAKNAARFSEAEKIASKNDHLFEPLPKIIDKAALVRVESLKKRHPSLLEEDSESSRYRIVQDSMRSTAFFDYQIDGARLILIINSEHPFYRDIYLPLSEAEDPKFQQLRAKLELVLLSAARSEVSNRGSVQRRDAFVHHRQDWSDVLATFLNS